MCRSSTSEHRQHGRILLDLDFTLWLQSQECASDNWLSNFNPLFRLCPGRLRDGMAGEFRSDRALKTAIVDGLKRHGVYKAGIKFYPSVVHTDEDTKVTLAAFAAAVAEAV